MAHRTFKDRNGRTWEVWEVVPQMVERRDLRKAQPVTVERRNRDEPRAPLPRNLHNGWLVFDSRTERRRLVPTPAGWEVLADTDLAVLLERATLKVKPRRLIE